MKYTKLVENKKVKFEIVLDKSEWTEQVKKAYEQNKDKYEIQGFRKGKAPKHLIEQKYGENVFYEEAINNAYFKYYNEILDKEKEIEVIARPRIDIKDLSAEGVTIIVDADIKPEVELGEYKGIEINKEKKSVSAKEIDSELDKMKEKSARLIEVDRKVETGDTVIFDFSGSIDGETFDGGTSKDFELEIGSKRFIPGFEEKLIGLEKNTEKDITITFPDDYHEEKLKGKETVFNVKINNIKKTEYPEINDDFAKEYSEFETIDDLKKDIKKKIKETHEKNAEYKAENDLVDKITENAKVDMPDSIIESQLEENIKRLEQRLTYQGIGLNDYINMLKITMDDFKKKQRPDAEKGAKTKLVLEAIIKAEKLDVTKEEIDKKINEIAKKENKSVEEYSKSMNEHQINHILNDLTVTKLLDFLRDNNKIS